MTQLGIPAHLVHSVHVGDRSVLDAIGGTPVVDLTPLVRPLVPELAEGVRLLAKLESQNPTGSVKDRVALSMLTDALERGALDPGQTILEPTSGNTGISLAMIARLMGHPLRVVMPANATPERVQILELFGAQIVQSSAAEGSNGAVRLAQQLAADDASLFMPMQYENPANPNAHYHGTAPELLEQAGGQVDVFVAGLGTGGTLMGMGRRLREANPEVQIVAAEPMPGDPVMGLRSLEDGYVPPVLDTSLLTRRILVSTVDSVHGTRALAQAGVFAGVSAGGIFHVATRMAREAQPGATIAMIVPDHGWKYLSAGLWTREMDELTPHLDEGQWW